MYNEIEKGDIIGKNGFPYGFMEVIDKDDRKLTLQKFSDDENKARGFFVIDRRNIESGSFSIYNIIEQSSVVKQAKTLPL